MQWLAMKQISSGDMWIPINNSFSNGMKLLQTPTVAAINVIIFIRIKVVEWLVARLISNYLNEV